VSAESRPTELVVKNLPGDRQLEEEAERWTQRFAARGRWSDNPEATARIEGEARELLKSREIDAAELIPGEDGTWRAQLSFDADAVAVASLIQLPWESLLGETTRRERGSRTLVATRLVRGLPEPPVNPAGTPLIVVSQPREFAGLYSFESEVQLLSRALGEELKPRVLLSPTLAELRKDVSSQKPRWVHITGFDAEQGASLSNREPATDPKTGAPDQGLFMRDPKGGVAIVTPKELARATGATPLVTFNFLNSESAMCVEALRAGSVAAIGLQKGVPDDVAEGFFFVFYQQLSESKSTAVPAIRRAFDAALTKAGENQGLRGTEIRLWHRE
jgi:CHAT domain